AERPGEPAWGSRFGLGRPGWHVECAAIATDYLGSSFDVQAGGTDLVYPHHEMSASHARVACSSGDGDEAVARVYAHSGMVAYQGAKMSKSLGNLVFVSRLRAAGVDPMAIRLALVAHHYRSDWEWTDAVLAEAQGRLDRWRAAVARTALARGTALAGGLVPSAASALPAADAVLATVRERLADDLDAPGAVAAVDAWADAVLAGPGGAEPADAALIRDTVDALLGVAL
ncbi:MAG: cysteine--1-D-myo-inosityl 2-amino-2-deoxy-alpha-D-glucopyranoside ligase, partial [Trebonia sp.]